MTSWSCVYFQASLIGFNTALLASKWVLQLLSGCSWYPLNKHSSLTCILCSIHQLFTCSEKENGINHSLEFKYTTALHIQPITELVLPQLYKLGLVVYLQKFAAYTALPLIAL